jgi:hypothetical protein
MSNSREPYRESYFDREKHPYRVLNAADLDNLRDLANRDPSIKPTPYPSYVSNLSWPEIAGVNDMMRENKCLDVLPAEYKADLERRGIPFAETANPESQLRNQSVFDIEKRLEEATEREASILQREEDMNAKEVADKNTSLFIEYVLARETREFEKLLRDTKSSRAIINNTMITGVCKIRLQHIKAMLLASMLGSFAKLHNFMEEWRVKFKPVHSYRSGGPRMKDSCLTESTTPYGAFFAELSGYFEGQNYRNSGALHHKKHCATVSLDEAATNIYLLIERIKMYVDVILAGRGALPDRDIIVDPLDPHVSQDEYDLQVMEFIRKFQEF